MVVYFYNDFVYINQDGKNYSDTYENYRLDGGSYSFQGYTEYDTDTNVAVINDKTIEEIPQELLQIGSQIDILLENQSKRIKDTTVEETEEIELNPKKVRRMLLNLGMKQDDLESRITELEEQGESENGEEERE